MSNVNYNPDVLTCLANLSNDEVFTPPEVANSMLDLLPQELFTDPNTTFLDPCTKSGVFLREIVKRLIKGLASKIPNLQERLDHILHKQVFGIAITEITSLLARRSLYCSKYPSSKYSISLFDDVQGNVRFKRGEHAWKNGKCMCCGANENEYKRDEGLESHAYEFIHKYNLEEIFGVKFDVIIGNPPYQLNDGGNAASASPLYHLFVQQAIKLNPRYLTMIIPARWYAGGKGLDSFRSMMINQSHISKLVDIANSSDCFPGVNIAGGICYFLWERNYSGLCNVVNMVGGNEISACERSVGEFSYFVRNNTAISIIKKIQGQNEPSFADLVFSRNYFGLPTTILGSSEKGKAQVPVLTSKGLIYLDKNRLSDKKSILNDYKVIITYAMSGGNKPSQDGKYQILSTLKVLRPMEACTETYLILATFKEERQANNLVKYAATKFFRFLLLQALSSIHITKDKFCFVPSIDISKEWNDRLLFEKYQLTEGERELIESTIKPMEGE